MSGFAAVFRKEALHMRRDGGTLRFGLLIPVFQLVLFGSIDTNVRHVPTVVVDFDKSQASRELLEAFEATSFFKIERYVDSRDQLREEIVAGHASVGVEVPPNYNESRLYGRTAQFSVLIDGSESAIAGQTLGAADGIALGQSLRELSERLGVRNLPVEARPRILFNPDSRSANLLIPGLIAILLTFSGTILSAFAIVRERERGTLEQLMVTPVTPTAMILGKLAPYLVLAFVQLALVLLLMNIVFRVPVNGSVMLLATLSVVYLTALLSLGLVISARARTQVEAIGFAQAFLLPSIMLSGYIFPLSSLPAVLRALAQVLPATHFITISRAIIIRGASFPDLWHHVAALAAISLVLLATSVWVFKRTRY
jgi:ABC-2 type transport system permease protein